MHPGVFGCTANAIDCCLMVWCVCVCVCESLGEQLYGSLFLFPLCCVAYGMLMLLWQLNDAYIHILHILAREIGDYHV